MTVFLTIFICQSELKDQFLIKERENVWIKHLNDSKAFIAYSECMDDVYNNIDDYNPSRKRKKINCVWWYDCRYYD